MSISRCILDGYTFPCNPDKYANPLPDTSQRVTTLGGSYIQDWTPKDGDRTITMVWGGLQYAAMYAALLAKSQVRTTLSFTDPEGVVWTVWAQPPVEETLTPGGSGYYSNVSMSLWVVKAGYP